ncbi:MAG: hypothetical protein P1V97_02565 [Planctomycetota bacterium]|nr:hypothetical protein [Planctomycetota bacterium]
MSASEKTHMVVILLVVLGGFMVLGCVVLAGATLFVSSAPMAVGPPPVAMATQVKSSSGSSGMNILKVTKTVQVSPGQYEVTVTDTDTDSNDPNEFNDYNFVVESIVTPKTTITIKSQPKGDPLPTPMETVLLIKTGADQKTVEFAYGVTKAGATHTSNRKANLVLVLQHTKDPKELEAKTPEEKTPTPK